MKRKNENAKRRKDGCIPYVYDCASTVAPPGQPQAVVGPGPGAASGGRS